MIVSFASVRTLCGPGRPTATRGVLVGAYVRCQQRVCDVGRDTFRTRTLDHVGFPNAFLNATFVKGCVRGPVVPGRSWSPPVLLPPGIAKCSGSTSVTT